MLSAFYICCIHVYIQIHFRLLLIMEANTMNQVQIFPYIILLEIFLMGGSRGGQGIRTSPPPPGKSQVCIGFLGNSGTNPPPEASRDVGMALCVIPCQEPPWWNFQDLCKFLPVYYSFVAIFYLFLASFYFGLFLLESQNKWSPYISLLQFVKISLTFSITDDIEGFEGSWAIWVYGHLLLTIHNGIHVVHLTG